MATSGTTDAAPQQIPGTLIQSPASAGFGMLEPGTKLYQTSYGYLAVSPSGEQIAYSPSRNIIRAPTELTIPSQQYESGIRPISTYGKESGVSTHGYYSPEAIAAGNVPAGYVAPSPKPSEPVLPSSLVGTRLTPEQSLAMMKAPVGTVVDVPRAVTTSGGYTLQTSKGTEYFLTQQEAELRSMQLAPKPGEPGYHGTTENPLGIYQPIQPKTGVPLFDASGKPNIRFEGAAPAPEFKIDAKYGLMIRQDLYKPSLPLELQTRQTTPVSEFVTYPIYKAASGFSQSAASWIEGKTGYTKDSSVLTKLAVGMAEGITSMPEFAGAGLIGAEAIVRQPKQVVPLVGAGIVTTIGGIKTGFETKPVETVGSFVGPAVLGKAVGKISISEKLLTIGIGKPKGLLIDVGEVPVTPKTGIVKPTVSWKEFQAMKGLKGEVSPNLPKFVTPIGSERLAPRTIISPSTVTAVSGWSAYAGKPSIKETTIKERQLMGTPEGTLGDLTFETKAKQPVAGLYLKPPESSIGDIMNRLTGQIEYVKTPEGSFMKIKPTGFTEGITSGVKGFKQQISGTPKRTMIGEVPKPSSALSFPTLSRYIRLERKLLIEPTKITRTTIPVRPALPEVTWDIEMGKTTERPGKPVEYDIYGGKVTGKGMQPTEPLVSGVPERLQLTPREVSDFDVRLSMMKKERAVSTEAPKVKSSYPEQATIDLAESVRTSMEEPISTYKYPTASRVSTTKTQPMLKTKTRTTVMEAPTTEYKIASEPLMTKAEQQELSKLGAGTYPSLSTTIAPTYKEPTKGRITAPQTADISITAKYFGINPADVNLFGYSDMTFISPTGSIQPTPFIRPTPTPSYYPSPYPRYSPSPSPYPSPEPSPYPSPYPSIVPRPSPYPEPRATPYPDIILPPSFPGLKPPKLPWDERKKRKAKGKKKEGYVLGYRGTPLIEPLAGVGNMFGKLKKVRKSKSKKGKK